MWGIIFLRFKRYSNFQQMVPLIPVLYSTLSYSWRSTIVISRSPLCRVLCSRLIRLSMLKGMYDEVYDRSEICATFVAVQKMHPVPLLCINDYQIKKTWLELDYAISSSNTGRISLQLNNVHRKIHWTCSSWLRHDCFASTCCILRTF